MKTRRIPWEILLTLVAGFALGLSYAWFLSPVKVVDSAPEALRSDFKDTYRAAIAASYAANGDLPRAQARLALLADADPYSVLSAQAQRMLAAGEPFQSVQQVAALASALKGLGPTATIPLPTLTARSGEAVTPAAETPTQSNPSEPSAPLETDTPFPDYTPTARPTRTPTLLPGAPFELLAQETLCDETLPEGILQVFAITTARRQIPGVELILAWLGGEEHFFTGFKPELGNGYADYQMSPGLTYTLRAADGGTPIAGLTPPSCTAVNGETYFGGLRITLQRP